MPKTTALLLTTLLVPLSLGSDTPAGPQDVVAAFNHDAVTLTWTPIPTASYNVYGFTDGTPTLITTTNLISVNVPPIFDQYGVSALLDGEETSITLADYCIRVMPPGSIPPFIITEC